MSFYRLTRWCWISYILFMSLKCGIVGLPNVGKSTIFNALTKSHGADVQNFPFCTIDPNMGIVEVPDTRFDQLVELVQPKKKVPASMEFVDIAGLVKGAAQGEGLGNQFLSHIREVDAVLHVVRCFEDENVTHVSGEIDPVSDVEAIELELILADLEMIQKRQEKLSKQIKAQDQKAIKENDIWEGLSNSLKRGEMVTSSGLTKEESALIAHLNLLTNKPFILVGNLHENDIAGLSSPQYKTLAGHAQKQGMPLLPVSAKVESELVGISPEEEKEFLVEMGLKEASLNAVIREAYLALGYITFFTAGEQEVRAWNITRGSAAQEAAGKIHTDIQQGFIRAEVTSFDDCVEWGGLKAAQSKGKMRLEGKDYTIQDGDIVYFRFNV